MENPAHVYTTGIPMSQKGKFSHNQYGCDAGTTLNNVSINKVTDHDYPNLDLCDSSAANVEYIHSIQDGFQQTDMLCEFVCDADLESDGLPLENSSLEDKSISESDSHIKFPDSPGSSFPCKIDTFPSIEGLVHSFDEHLENLLLPDYKTVSKSSEDVSTSMEEERRTVTEAISEIAKSFTLEDLLPGTYSNSKGLSAEPDSLCEDDNISGLTLGDFERCSALSPTNSLDLNEQLPADAQGLELNALEMLASPSQACLKLTEDSSCQENYDLHNAESEAVSDELPFQSDLIGGDLKTLQTYELSDNTMQQCDEVQILSDVLDSDIPTVRISDVEASDCLTEVNENGALSAGTVVITRDKVSKKMQIVLTLDQGQKIYDIDTESLANEQSLDLDLQNALSEEQFPETSVEITEVTSDELEQVSAEVEADMNSSVVEDDTMFDAAHYMELLDKYVPLPKVRKSKTQWICPIPECGQIMDKECKLRVHMINHKGDRRPFKCSFVGCDWAFTTPYRLRRHIETHLGSKEHMCDVEGCNRKFTTVYNLNTHKKRHKRHNYLLCPSKDCTKSFDNRRQLESHLRVHKDVEAPYKCTLCGKQYYSPNCVASHLRTHQYNEDDFKCPFQGCGKVYDKICRLRQHIRHHTGDRPYTCPAEGCNWSFMSASKLTRHMRKHTGERRFTCTEPGCGKSFMRPEHLKGHIVIHSGDKPFHCPHENCNAKFTAKSSLYVHVKKHRSSVLKVVYPCVIPSCLRKYNSKSTLKQHLMKFHADEIDDVKTVEIKEKLELTMPVSLVNPHLENGLGLLELEDRVVDDPLPSFKKELLQSTKNSLSKISSISAEVNVSAGKNVPKTSKGRGGNHIGATKNTAKNSTRTSEPPLSSKVVKSNSSGCARTDFCFNKTAESHIEISPNFSFLNYQNSIDNHDSKSYLSNGHVIGMKSLDVMLASSYISHDNCSESLMKSNFLSDDCSTGHSLYHDDSVLAGSSTFGSELIPVSLLSDDVESDESGLNSGVVFSEQNSVDAFSSILD